MQAEPEDQGEPTEDYVVDPDAEIADFDELESYKPIMGVAVIVGFVFTVILTGLLRALGMPAWLDIFIYLPFLCMPLIFFTRWVWNKPAVRMPDRTVLRQDEARRLGLRACAEYAFAAVRATWQISLGMGWAAAQAARWIRLRLLSPRP